MNPSESDRQFEAVVRECHSAPTFFTRSLGVGEAWVDDLAQETLLLAYRPPLLPALRSGHRLLQRQPPQKQIPSRQK